MCIIKKITTESLIQDTLLSTDTRYYLFGICIFKNVLYTTNLNVINQFKPIEECAQSNLYRTNNIGFKQNQKKQNKQKPKNKSQNKKDKYEN